MSALNQTKLSATDLAALGITNQRETTLVWNRHTGLPYYNAIVWQDTRTDRIASALERDGRGDQQSDGELSPYRQIAFQKNERRHREQDRGIVGQHP